MAIFKILQGSSSRIDLKITPFHEGWAYFTPDNGGLYIDAVVNGEQKRIRINPNSAAMEPVEGTLLATGWASGRQTLTVSGVTEKSNGIICLSSNISDTQMESAKNADMYVYSQGKDSITIAVSGEVPQTDIPVAAILIGGGGDE